MYKETRGRDGFRHRAEQRERIVGLKLDLYMKNVRRLFLWN